MKRKWKNSSQKKVTIDKITFYLAKGAILHPLLYVEYLKMVKEMSHKNKVCLLTSTILELHYIEMKSRILIRFADEKLPIYYS